MFTSRLLSFCRPNNGVNHVGSSSVAMIGHPQNSVSFRTFLCRIFSPSPATSGGVPPCQMISFAGPCRTSRRVVRSRGDSARRLAQRRCQIQSSLVCFPQPNLLLIHT
jgi:hypothetical protein